jgi:hypothetical protein
MTEVGPGLLLAAASAPMSGFLQLVAVQRLKLSERGRTSTLP